MTKHGHFHWNELMTGDAEAAKSFYAETIGWSFDGWDMGEGGTYWVAMAGEVPVGGIFQMSGLDSEGGADHWMSYLAVDDVDARLDKARAHGITVVREPFDVPQVGRIAMLREPGGATIGWMTPSDAAD